MGADLLVSILLIEHGRSPDWAAAERHLKQLPDVDLDAAIERATGLSTEDVEESIEVYRHRAWTALLEVRAGWEEGGRCILRIENLAVPGGHCDALVGGDVSWGDGVQEVEWISIFAETGAAKAAGFAV